MNIPKKTSAAILLLILSALSACESKSNSVTGGLTGVWGVVSEHIRTDFTSRASHTVAVSLNMNFENLSPNRSKVVFGGFTGNSLGLRTFTRKIAEGWSHPGLIPLMIVDDRSAFEKRLVSLALRTRNGKTIHPEWSWEPVKLKGASGRWWLVIPSTIMHVVRAQVTLRKTVSNRKGYYSSFKIRVPHDALVKNISGCIRFPKDAHFSTQVGTNMRIHLLKQIDGRAYGFCYKNGTYKDNQTGITHYVAVSTAKDWSDVASSMRQVYQEAESKGHSLLPRVMEKIKRGDTDISKDMLVNRSRHWIVQNLKYSVTRSILNAPHTFDDVINQKSGVCTDLALVLTMLLRKEGVQAHPALTSATLRDVFNLNAADLSRIDHMVVYLPEQNVYLDPDVDNPRSLLTTTKRQLLDIVTGKVVAAPEAPFPGKG